MLWDIDEFLRRELQHESHDADVRPGFGQRLRRFGRTQGLELVDLELLLFGRCAQGVGPRPFLFRRAEYGGDLVAARKKCLHDCLAKVLLADDRNTHNVVL